MQKRMAVWALLLFLMLSPSAEAEALSLVLQEHECEYSFRLPETQFALLEYSTANQKGSTVLYAEDGVFGGQIDLSQSAGCRKLKVEVKTLKGVSQGSATLDLSMPVPEVPSGRTNGKVQNLTLQETTEGFAYSFRAEDVDYMILAYHSVQERGQMYVYPQDAAGNFSGEVKMPLTYARSLMTVQLENAKGLVLKEDQVRKGYEPPAAPEAQQGRLSGVTVCIDPGHQENGVPVMEPVGPGLEGKTAGSGGMAEGCVTRRKEAIVTLEAAYALRDELLRQGANVVMTRTQQMEFHTNMERCQIAKDGGADVMLRLHCDTRETSTKRGISIFSPLHSTYAQAVADTDTYRHMGDLLLNAMKRAVGYELTEKTGFVTLSDAYVGNNWAEMPCFLVEMGYLSNPEDDYLLSHSVYQHTLAEGMAQGVYEIAVFRGLIQPEE